MGNKHPQVSTMVVRNDAPDISQLSNGANDDHTVSDQALDRDIYIYQVFAFLSFNNLASCRLVSREWNFMVNQVKNLQLIIEDELYGEKLKSFEKSLSGGLFCNVTMMTIANVVKSKYWSRMGNLQIIHVQNGKFKDSGTLDCKPLAVFGNLKEFVFKGSHVTNATSMRNLKVLRKLEVRYVQTQSEIWKNINAPLEILEIYSCKFVDLEHLVEMGKSSIKSLGLGSVVLDQKQLESLSKLELLESFIFNQMKFRDLIFISQLRGLKRLKMQTNSLNSKHCECLEGLTNITKLDLSENQITHVNFLRKMCNIQVLKLMHNRIGDEECQTISSLGTLAKLCLTGNEISSDGVKFLSLLEKLQYLNLGENMISDIGPISKNLINLERLSLYLNTISSIDVSKLVKLRVLDLANNPIEKFEGIDDLKLVRYLSIFSKELGKHPIEKLFNSQSFFPKLEILDLQSKYAETPHKHELNLITPERFPTLQRFNLGNYEWFGESLELVMNHSMIVVQ